MTLQEILLRYRFRDLIPYGLAQVLDAADRLYSSVRFMIQCLWHGVELTRSPPPKVWGRAKIRRFPRSQIQIGSGFRLVTRSGRYAYNIFPQALIRTYSETSRVIIGSGVGVNSVALFCRSQTIRIGDNTMIGGNCQIMDSDGHPLWPPASRWNYSGSEHDRSVDIGANVFIGLNVIILKGARIGDGSIIAAGSIVRGDIPANCLAAGIPAKVVRYFASSVEAEMLATGVKDD